ncbi:MAG: hypothetical protein K5650_06415 [Bacteroidales bacterium]|nr:hypothetical protein [Bacteroidales bacterium]
MKHICILSIAVAALAFAACTDKEPVSEVQHSSDSVPVIHSEPLLKDYLTGAWTAEGQYPAGVFCIVGGNDSIYMSRPGKIYQYSITTDSTMALAGCGDTLKFMPQSRDTCLIGSSLWGDEPVLIVRSDETFSAIPKTFIQYQNLMKI